MNCPSRTGISTLSLHDALPISERIWAAAPAKAPTSPGGTSNPSTPRSEEHTSELQSRGHLVCRLLLEKKKNKSNTTTPLQMNTTATPQSPPHHRTRQPPSPIYT